MTQIEPQPAVNPGLEAAIAGKTQRKVRSAKIQLEGVASSPTSSNQNHLPLVLHCFHLLLRLVDVWYLEALQAIFLNANKSESFCKSNPRPLSSSSPGLFDQQYIADGERKKTATGWKCMGGFRCRSLQRTCLSWVASLGCTGTPSLSTTQPQIF